MNNFHSLPEYYLRRWITPLLQQALEDFPVVVLTGARQVGKSTLLLHSGNEIRWLDKTILAVPWTMITG